MDTYSHTSFKDLESTHNSSCFNGKAWTPTIISEVAMFELLRYGLLLTSSVFLRAKVNPSQNSPDDAHYSWIAVKPDGEVITAHCTCMEG